MQQIDHYHLGSLLLTVPADGPSLSKSEPFEIAMLINQLQHDNKVPLLMAADYERGLSMRLNGVTVFPHAMAFGAAGKPELAERFGKIVAEESRAIGVEWNLFPDADVNSNPANPVINTRSFGENPTQVGAMASAYIRGARSSGLLTAAKHFPGHGDTATDSHLGVAAVNRSRDQIEQIDLPPFRASISAGTDAVMVAHVTAPALEPDPMKVCYHFWNRGHSSPENTAWLHRTSHHRRHGYVWPHSRVSRRWVCCRWPCCRRRNQSRK